MTLRRALGVAAADLYHQAWRMAILNLTLGFAVALVVLAALAVRPAIVLAVLLGPLAAAIMHCAITLAQTEELRMGEALVGLRQHWRRGIALGLLFAAAILFGVLAVPFYARAGTWAWPFAALTVYILLLFCFFQLALWPVAVYEQERPFRAVVRDALLVAMRRPFGFVALGVLLVLVNAIGLVAAIIPFLTMTVAYSFLVSAHFALPKNPAREA
jgi:uncharacterized membrane protein YesL